ncbi:hypothetical protein GCM10010172_39090 [Paractinoplanes ferrugineus]|uniref:Uncharacterized protein n=1 Tax=Paractinoplanes ferrugineus TaxID=113564 RepID=A0A919J1F1_9ACTN|nr:hypothetical protein [Actinoplanes ferrugineus]GIE12685.1 hypothetical protein Afe05nite_45250 [Actinoplanes ferrugineus]
MTTTARIPEPLATGDRPLWDMWRGGGPTRTHLVSGYDRKSWLPAVTFDDPVRDLGEDGVQLELR